MSYTNVTILYTSQSLQYVEAVSLLAIQYQLMVGYPSKIFSFRNNHTWKFRFETITPGTDLVS
jgi:hypothetical protein